MECADGKSYEVTPDLVKIEPIIVTEYGESIATFDDPLMSRTQSETSHLTSSSRHSVLGGSCTRYSSTATGLESRTKLE